MDIEELNGMQVQRRERQPFGRVAGFGIGACRVTRKSKLRLVHQHQTANFT